MPSYGEQPGAGTYECPYCTQRVVIEHDWEVLGECPACEGFVFLSVDDDAEENEGQPVVSQALDAIRSGQGL